MPYFIQLKKLLKKTHKICFKWSLFKYLQKKKKKILNKIQINKFDIFDFERKHKKIKG